MSLCIVLSGYLCIGGCHSTFDANMPMLICENKIVIFFELICFFKKYTYICDVHADFHIYQICGICGKSGSHIYERRLLTL